ncbi:methyltransferase family protein, partial [Eubacterium aggregans]|uniref:methyltransferase family protein n=1 Tax=Eubacterium aggregans TaxID=81409 RepID=UPI003F327A9F
MVWLKYDPNTSGGQYLEDLATAYWYSDTLFTALNLGLFDFLDCSPNATTADMAEGLNLDEGALLRFLKLLKSLDLVDCYEDTWYNTQLSSDYLVVGRPLYQGGNIRWREELQGDWSTLKDVL